MEIVVIILPVIIALLLGAWAILAPRPVDVVSERARLDQHVAWLIDRLAHARDRHWGEDMVARIEADLARARRERGALEPPSTPRT